MSADTPKGYTEADLLDLIKERDNAADWADALAAGIAEVTGVEIGEHSTMNEPWRDALDAIESAAGRLRQPADDAMDVSETVLATCQVHDDCRFWDLTHAQCARYHGRLVRYLRRRVKALEVEDAVQDAQLRIWRWSLLMSLPVVAAFWIFGGGQG